jgi:hypothetical protein
VGGKEREGRKGQDEKCDDITGWVGGRPAAISPVGTATKGSITQRFCSLT